MKAQVLLLGGGPANYLSPLFSIPKLRLFDLTCSADPGPFDSHTPGVLIRRASRSIIAGNHSFCQIYFKFLVIVQPPEHSGPTYNAGERWVSLSQLGMWLRKNKPIDTCLPVQVHVPEGRIGSEIHPRIQKLRTVIP